MDRYSDIRDEKNIKKIREICQGFPSFVINFFIGIQMRTSTLTRLNYAYDLRIFFDYLVNEKFRNDSKKVAELTIEDLEKVTAFDVELFLEHLSSYVYNGKKIQCGERAKQRKLATLRSFFKYYFKKDLLTANVASKVDMPKIHDNSIIRLETNEVVDLLNLIENENIIGLSKREQNHHNEFRLRNSAILTLLLGTGIRISECVGLNIEDLDFSTNGFTVTRKGGSKSILYFSDEIADVLSKYLTWLKNEKANKSSDFGSRIKDNRALFISNKGTRMTPRSIELMVKKYSQKVVPLKKITPHKLRSTFGTELYRETQDIYVVADVLGHKDINTTRKHYAAMSDDIRRNAANKVKLRDKDKDKN